MRAWAGHRGRVNDTGRRISERSRGRTTRPTTGNTGVGNTLVPDGPRSVAKPGRAHRGPGRSEFATAWWHYVTDSRSARRIAPPVATGGPLASASHHRACSSRFFAAGCGHERGSRTVRSSDHTASRNSRSTGFSASALTIWFWPARTRHSAPGTAAANRWATSSRPAGLRSPTAICTGTSIPVKRS